MTANQTLHGVLLIAMAGLSSSMAATVRVDVNIMPRVVFTGDSQTCGCVGAWDYPQMLSWEMPVRILNTAVGGTNTRHLLFETSGGTAEVKQGEKAVCGTKVSWYAGPYPGQKIRLGPNEYTIDRIQVISHNDQAVTIWLTEPAREAFSGTDYAIEAGWRVRMVERRPDYACFMYSVNDTGYDSATFTKHIEEILTRVRDLGARPVFLSGVPLMEKWKGGSHPGDNRKVDTRANDMAAVCAKNQVPFGDVFHTLMLLDEQVTSDWVDTVHPTTDGSMVILNAVRSIFRDLGLDRNPYYIRGYRATNGLAAPDQTLVPLTTSQPRVAAGDKKDGDLFDLSAIRVQDKYELMSRADGDCVESIVPLVLKFGIGEPGRIAAAQAEFVVASPTELSLFDWQRNAWQPLARGTDRIEAPLAGPALAAACRDGAVWLGLTPAGDGKVLLDYAAVTISGDVAPFQFPAAGKPIVWPHPGEFTWEDAPANLVRNGSLAVADGDRPAHWQKSGDQALYLLAGVVAEGLGEFGPEKLNRFHSAGQHFTKAVRPLDVLVVPEGAEEVTGRFIVPGIPDDESLWVRRPVKTSATGLRFQVTRSSGCGAVPGGCMIECRDGAWWETTVAGLDPGSYRLGFFYRAFAPAKMNAQDTPGSVTRVSVSLGGKDLPVSTEGPPASYQWQRAWLEFKVPASGDLQVRVSARTDAAAQYTGFSLQAVK